MLLAAAGPGPEGERHDHANFDPRSSSSCLLTVVTGVVYPGVVTADRRSWLSRSRPTAASSRVDGKRRRLARCSASRSPIPGTSGAGRRRRARSRTTAPRRPGSNQGAINPALDDCRHGARRGACAPPIRATTRPVPVDLVTASGSGLDPQISPAAADYQVRARGARARHCRRTTSARWSSAHTEGRTFGVLGEPRVNVLRAEPGARSTHDGLRLS